MLTLAERLLKAMTQRVDGLKPTTSEATKKLKAGRTSKEIMNGRLEEKIRVTGRNSKNALARGM